MSAIEIAQHPRVLPQFAEQLRAIYLDSFPPHERAEFAFMENRIASGARWLYTASRGDDLLGFAILVPYIARDVHLLEYLAVARDARSGGIGGVLLDGLVAAIRERALREDEGSQSALGMLLEVEHDAEGNADERALRQRRIAFYIRHGAHLVDAPNYRVPRADLAGTLRMKLLWLPITADAETPRGDKLRACVTGILEKSYGMSRMLSAAITSSDLNLIQRR